MHNIYITDRMVFCSCNWSFPVKGFADVKAIANRHAKKNDASTFHDYRNKNFVTCPCGFTEASKHSEELQRLSDVHCRKHRECKIVLDKEQPHE
jgi:hypothetical protein